jgi:hypothetical protein
MKAAFENKYFFHFLSIRFNAFPFIENLHHGKKNPMLSSYKIFSWIKHQICHILREKNLNQHIETIHP